MRKIAKYVLSMHHILRSNSKYVKNGVKEKKANFLPEPLILRNIHIINISINEKDLFKNEEYIFKNYIF